MSTPPSFLTFQQRLRNAMGGAAAQRWDMLCDLRVAVPGIIQTFDPSTQTATVVVAIRENILDPETRVPTPTQIPVLSDVPVIMFRAGGFAITFPVQAGDECLLIFGDNDYGAWWQSGGVQNQIDRRRHDLSDSFAIVGLWSQPNVLENYSPDSVQLRSVDGNRIIEIDNANVNINVTGGKVTVTSDTEVDISATTVKLQGKNFLTHTHSGIATGGGTSGPVTP